MPPTFAVLFKTHFWDDFTRRQLARLHHHSGRGDVYITMDETFRPASPIDYPRVVPTTMADLQRLQLPPITTHGSVIWYNNDYPHYVALAALPRYDYYIACEYDVVLHTLLDALIDSIAADGADFVGFPMRTPIAAWPWFPMHRATYGDGMLQYLTCFAVYSHRALTMLLSRRQRMSREFAEGTLPFWPLCEAFLPNEVQRAGMQLRSLADYGNTEGYDWWPPIHEDAVDRPEYVDKAFLHPVLQGTRLLRSRVPHEPSLRDLLRPQSRVRQELAA